MWQSRRGSRGRGRRRGNRGRGRAEREEMKPRCAENDSFDACVASKEGESRAKSGKQKRSIREIQIY